MGSDTSTQLDMMASKRSMMPENLTQLVIRKVSTPNWVVSTMAMVANSTETPASSQATG